VDPLVDAQPLAQLKWPAALGGHTQRLCIVQLTGSPALADAPSVSTLGVEELNGLLTACSPQGFRR
jgi:hypothetical protein